MYTKKQIVKNGFLMAIVAGTFMACGQSNNANNAAKSASDSASSAATGLKIAYVDLDSLEAHYEFFKQKKAELERKQLAMDNEIQADARVLQEQYNSLQRRANTLTQAEGEAIQRDLMAKNQNLEQKRQTLSRQYMEVEQSFNDELRKKLDSFLLKFNADKRYGYIFSYRDGGTNILYKDPAYDITDVVTKGLNDEAAAKK
ncbi:periplasmic chaperone for outer membrane proteins Skp [Chitinophaga skermanii]|uniref:Periplasmic chaperone for outer membrane proteins Skp n=1 Tax=Chitinophaga skermanii TaxID=331697 RepID=A0A327Q585_9BACT|nr:OmpH family outer membrane protein [Chitinophaga skermanii]RAI99695.1 periplasmic chaperone for outer membrane proteins Skp [Chitinophaga skermanii]